MTNDEWKRMLRDSGKWDGSPNPRTVLVDPVKDSLIALLQESQEAIDVLAQDAEEAGYNARAESATDLAMRIRSAIAKATGQ